LDRLEAELQVPVVASSLARMWDILSKIGLGYKIPGYGRLLATWPPLPHF
jgi:maleate cis-trans isomerase